MGQPAGFSWIEKPRLAALARPADVEDLQWLRGQGIQLLITLTEDRLRRDWIDEAGLLGLHVPMVDMEAPTIEQLDLCVSAVRRAMDQEMGVAIHCEAGMGRTGVVLAAFFVDGGLSAQNAISRVRRLRPGSIETEEQLEIIEEYARHRGKGLHDE